MLKNGKGKEGHLIRIALGISKCIAMFILSHLLNYKLFGAGAVSYTEPMLSLKSKNKVGVQKILIHFLLNGLQSVLLKLLNARKNTFSTFLKKQASL